MFVDKSMIKGASEHYKGMLLYHQHLEHLFEVLDRRLEYGKDEKKFLPISRKRLFTNSNNYSLYSHREYPGEIWLPPWHGRFYVDLDCLAEPINHDQVDDCLTDRIKHLAFVWTWLGYNDAYVADMEQPECWLGIVEIDSIDTHTRIYEVADMIWKFMRIEEASGKIGDQWVQGTFSPNNSGSRLKGYWRVKRFPLADISNMYGIQKLIVFPLTETFRELDRNPLVDCMKYP